MKSLKSYIINESGNLDMKLRDFVISQLLKRYKKLKGDKPNDAWFDDIESEFTESYIKAKFLGKYGKEGDKVTSGMMNTVKSEIESFKKWANEDF